MGHGKTTSSMRADPQGEGARSFDLLPAAAKRIPQGVEQTAGKSSRPRPKGTSFPEKSGMANHREGATGERGISLSSPMRDEHQGPFLRSKEIFQLPARYPQGATRAPRFYLSGYPATLEGIGLKSLRSLPPMHNSNNLPIHYTRRI